MSISSVSLKGCLLGALVLSGGLSMATGSAQASSTGIVTIAGKVDDVNRAVIPGASVEARSLQTDVMRRTTTNSTGQYTLLFNDSSTTFRVTVSSAGHATQVFDVKKAPGDDRIILNMRLGAAGPPRVNDGAPAGGAANDPTSLTPGAVVNGRFLPSDKFEITGTITDQAGNPLAGARVTAGGATVARGAMEEASLATTDTKGQFTLVVNGAASAFRIVVRAVGFLPLNQEVIRNGPSVVFNARLGVGAMLVTSPFAKTIVKRSELGATDAVDFWMRDGDITVTGTDDDFVSYEIVSKPEASHNQLPIDRLFDPANDGTHLVWGYGVRANGGSGMELRVTVPRNLKLLKLAVGRAGSIHVEHFRGEVSIISEQGTVNLRDIAGPAVIEARNGATTASFVGLVPGAAGNVSFLGSNGDITVTLPSDVKAVLSLSTHKGTIQSAFDRSEGGTTVVAGNGYIDGPPAAGDAIATRTIVNGGGTPVRISTVNGNIIVKKGPPAQH